MAHFPQPHRNLRAPRVRVPQSFPVVFTADNVRINGALQKLSLTGGAARLSQKCSPGVLAEIKLKTTSGMVEGLVEILSATSDTGPSQPFRFVALGEEDHERLSNAISRLRREGNGESAAASVRF